LVRYFPHTPKTSLGVRLEGAWLHAYGDSKTIDPETGFNGIPFYERYFLGGENQIRGTNIRSVGPRGPTGNIIGGNKYMLFNAEYYINIGGPLRFLFFFDAGQAFLEDEKMSFKDLRTSTGIEFRFLMPVLNVPFRLIYAWNPSRDASTPRTTFKFAVGTTF
jgi:outer membrane protein insertion porin family